MIRILMLACLLFGAVGTPALADVFEEAAVKSGPVPRYDPDAEALRSVLVPGWSQFRQGHTNAGWAYSIVAVTSAVFMAGVFEVPLIGDADDNFGQVLAGAVYGLNAVVSGFDAYRRATDSNRENGWDLESAAAPGRAGWRFTLVRLRF